MAITVNLVSEKKNMINDFLLAFFEKDMLTDENTLEWSYTLTDPLSSIELVSAITDNYNENDITCWISLDTNVLSCVIMIGSIFPRLLSLIRFRIDSKSSSHFSPLISSKNSLFLGCGFNSSILNCCIFLSFLLKHNLQLQFGMRV